MFVGIQSPIPLIYLLGVSTTQLNSWDSVTYPLDILAPPMLAVIDELGFSHLSP